MFLSIALFEMITEYLFVDKKNYQSDWWYLTSINKWQIEYLLQRSYASFDSFEFRRKIGHKLFR